MSILEFIKEKKGMMLFFLFVILFLFACCFVEYTQENIVDIVDVRHTTLAVGIDDPDNENNYIFYKINSKNIVSVKIYFEEEYLILSNDRVSVNSSPHDRTILASGMGVFGTKIYARQDIKRSGDIKTKLMVCVFDGEREDCDHSDTIRIVNYNLEVRS